MVLGCQMLHESDPRLRIITHATNEVVESARIVQLFNHCALAVVEESPIQKVFLVDFLGVVESSGVQEQRKYFTTVVVRLESDLGQAQGEEHLVALEETLRDIQVEVLE